MKVAILMSTYNGDKYVEEQIKSLLNQEGSDLEILIRDDGSNDNTIEILNKFENEYSNIKVLRGNNLGVAKSFIELLKYNIDADFYAFCDQDDVWEKNKVKNAINKLMDFNNCPALYYSEVKAVDTNLNILFESNYTGIDTLGSSFNTTPVIGCTTVINKVLRNIIVKNKLPDNIVMHDLYIYRVCLAIDGKIVHDSNSYIYYRQHEENVVGITNSILKKMKVYEKFNKTRREMAKSILEIYNTNISDMNRKILLKIANFHDNMKFTQKLSYIKDKDFKSKKIKSDLKFIYDVLCDNI